MKLKEKMRIREDTHFNMCVRYYLRIYVT